MPVDALALRTIVSPVGTDASCVVQVAPQLIAFGLEETLPEPVPPLFRVSVAVGLRANLALTDFALSIVTTQLPSGSDSQPLQPLNTFISVSAFVLIGVQVIFAFAFFWSMYKGEPAEQNPWKSNTLEWTAAPTPPPHGNFPAGTPVVYRGPYEYSSPESTDDFLPQIVPPDKVRRPPIPHERAPLVDAYMLR